jgi:NADH:ubiquinone oxidoreductase subunit 6 (subunit J)
MNLPVAILIVLGAAGVAFTAVVLVRRVAVLSNPTRGTPMAIVVGTSFAVLLAFLILAAFQTYTGARSGAASEANAVLDMSRTAALFRSSERDLLRSDLTCYGRAVVNYEWPAMRQGASSPLVDYWIGAYRSEFTRLPVRSPREQVAFQDLLTQAATRTVGRQQRLSEDTPAVPTPLWAALIFVGCVAVSLQLGMADPGERLRIQGPQVAAVAAVVTTGLLIINFLDHPYGTRVGGIQPTSMRHTLILMHSLDPGLRPPCTVSGRPA